MAENKIFAHTPEEVEALINKEGIEYVSVRFTDLIGVQQHFTVPASEFIDNAFTDGMPFDGSSVQGFQAINESDMKLIPDVTTAFVDPFRKHKTLDVAFSIVDPLTDGAVLPRPAPGRRQGRGLPEVHRHRRHRFLRSRSRVLHLRQGALREHHAALLLRGRHH